MCIKIPKSVSLQVEQNLKNLLFLRFFYFRSMHKINKGIKSAKAKIPVCSIYSDLNFCFFFPPLFIMPFWKYKNIFLPPTNFDFFHLGIIDSPSFFCTAAIPILLNNFFCHNIFVCSTAPLIDVDTAVVREYLIS